MSNQNSNVSCRLSFMLSFSDILLFSKSSQIGVLLPTDEVLQEMYNMLKSVIDKDPDGPMSRHISNVFAKYVKDKQLTGKLPRLSMYDLQYLKTLIGEKDIQITEYLEDFELD